MNISGEKYIIINLQLILKKFNRKNIFFFQYNTTIKAKMSRIYFGIGQGRIPNVNVDVFQVS